MKKSDSIKNWMAVKGVGDLKDRYHRGMEVQVNVIPGPERITENYKGRNYDRYTDGIQKWGPFRIPAQAKSDPVDNDNELTWQFEKHLQAIGMTGWNWLDKHSEYVGFDFDSIVNHSAGLSNYDLNQVVEKAMALDYVTVRRSTSGSGYHFEIHLDNIPTANHTEHAALARSILGKMCADTGYNFEEKVDCFGGILWIWHRKQEGTSGLEIVKQGNKLLDLPINWRDHISVVSGKRKRIKPQFVDSQNKEALFESLLKDKPLIRLNDEHQRLIDWLGNNNCQAWWDADHNMLVCHTYDLKVAHKELGMRGVYDTIAEGTEAGYDHNCFAFPLVDGSWSVRRYNPGVEEHPLWTQDGKGLTRCYFNAPADLESAGRATGGIEDEKGNFIFTEAAQAEEAVQKLGASAKVPVQASHREAMITRTKEGKLALRIKREDTDDAGKFQGWLLVNRKSQWQKVFHVHADRAVEPEVENHDELVRHLVSDQRGVDMGWVIRSNDKWIEEPKSNCQDLLVAQGIVKNKIQRVLGNCINNPFFIVNRPFEEEYPGHRKWNRNAAQLKYQPRAEATELSYPTWSSILQHCGSGLDDAIAKDDWCKQVGILTGEDWLKCWVASMFQTPKEPLPYLFFHGPENTGKSSFHESLKLLMNGGYTRADQALQNEAGYNAELMNAVLCVVEEVNLKMDKRAAARIKDWVTGVDIGIHEKRQTPILIENCTHWVQMANDIHSCPVGFGDTRIVFCHVPPLEKVIPRRELHDKLRKEAPDFITELMHIDIPRPEDRLGLKVINTEDKISASELMEDSFHAFLRTEVHHKPGQITLVSDLFSAYKTAYPDSVETKRQMIAQVPLGQFVKGRLRAIHKADSAGEWAFGNMSLNRNAEEKRPLGKEGEYLA